MKKNLIFLSFILFNLSLHAEIISCGDASIQGEIKELQKGKLFIVVNESTKSEIIFSTDKRLEQNLIPYENKSVSLNATISKLEGVSKGLIVKVSDIKLRVPNPLNGTNNTFVKIIKKSECAK